MQTGFPKKQKNTSIFGQLLTLLDKKSLQVITNFSTYLNILSVIFILICMYVYVQILQNVLYVQLLATKIC